jgi:hypothetical protein
MIGLKHFFVIKLNGKIVEPFNRLGDKLFSK